MNSNPLCTVCNSGKVTVLLEIEDIPVFCNVLWSSQEEALSTAKGKLKLGFCRQCGHIFNMAFDPQLVAYSPAYENSLYFSPRFQNYADALAERLVAEYDLYKKDIVEIGSGQGDFLRKLCRLGGNRGIGFDPSYTPVEEDQDPGDDITFVQELYSESFSHYAADLICSRHVLEHIQFPRQFLSEIRKSIGDRLDTVVFFEVPNALFTIRDLGIWDLIYEHCSYFTPSSLRYLFEQAGFEVIRLQEEFGQQYLCIEARPRAGSIDQVGDSAGDLDELASLVGQFSEKYEERVKTWHNYFGSEATAEKRMVIWGGGSKGVTFLNSLSLHDEIAYVVDVNPRKHGKYVPGTGQQIIPPGNLTQYQPDIVLIMNPVYYDEIKQMLDHLGVIAEIENVYE